MKMQPGRTWEARPALRQRSRPAFGQRRTCGRALVVVRGRESRPHGEGGQSDGSGTKRTTPEAGCMNPTRMAEKPMFPTHQSNPSDGEPDAVKVARPVQRGGWRKPAGAVRPSAAPSLPNAPPRPGSRRRSAEIKSRDLPWNQNRQPAPAGQTHRPPRG